uniref:Uncharacterized protein n=1 Tax=Cacopsylla melanoneura TaxID=428564 RepID=A0A8D9DZ19_9HEMI
MRPRDRPASIKRLPTPGLNHGIISNGERVSLEQWVSLNLNEDTCWPWESNPRLEHGSSIRPLGHRVKIDLLLRKTVIESLVARKQSKQSAAETPRRSPSQILLNLVCVFPAKTSSGDCPNSRRSFS